MGCTWDGEFYMCWCLIIERSIDVNNFGLAFVQSVGLRQYLGFGDFRKLFYLIEVL